MRRLLRLGILTTLALAVVPFAPPVQAQNSFSYGVIGVNFFRYKTAYVTVMNAAYNHGIAEGLELNLGGEFAIRRDDDDGDTEARFLVPANLGLNVTFPRDPVTFVFSSGITPVFNINPSEDEDLDFYIGPYIKGALRVAVHPIMSWYIEAQQDLLIGGPDWIYTGTRLATGINFAFTPRE